jgi:hypothetical protein
MSDQENHQLSQSASKQSIADAIMKFIGTVPDTREMRSNTPAERARSIANSAAARAATTAGALALPPGPLGWATILPEIASVWRIQSQMVADIAGAYGKTDFLSSNQMIYCLFRHGAAMAVRDVVVRVGDRYLIRQATQRVLQTVAGKIGVKVTQKAAAKTVSRWLPVIGAVGVGGYAYYDTAQVAKTAIDFFEADLEIEPASCDVENPE